MNVPTNSPYLLTADGQVMTIGSHWQHNNWLPGTPDAIVGEILLKENYFYWVPEHMGGSQLRGGSPHRMHQGNGWYRVR